MTKKEKLTNHIKVYDRIILGLSMNRSDQPTKKKIQKVGVFVLNPLHLALLNRFSQST